jgi:glycine/D-amino acid oxidase-like deaminating enzyme
MSADVIVVGGGQVGAAIAYGLAASGVKTLLIDGDDRDFRSAVANFGLVWAQGKGMNMPAYQELTRRSTDLWPDFCRELTDVTGVDLQYERKGGLALCLGEADFEARRSKLSRLDSQIGANESDWEMLDCRSLGRLLPAVPFGPEVVGASFGRRDGHVNPLRLLAALHSGIIRHGGEIRGGQRVDRLAPDGHGGYRVGAGPNTVSAARVVIAAGLGSKALAAQVGVELPIKPNRGQILVTERLEPFLPLPCSGLRQTREGTVMLGTTHDDVGMDTSTTTAAAVALSRSAVRRIPALQNATLVRQWAGLRIMTPDSYPIYSESESHAGVFVALCHSGVTLASSHATLVARSVAEGSLPASLGAFHQRRFDVPKAA